MSIKHITVRMNEYYGWTTGAVEPDAPNNVAEIRIDEDGSRWFDSISVSNITPGELCELAEFVAKMKLPAE